MNKQNKRLVVLALQNYFEKRVVEHEDTIEVDAYPSIVRDTLEGTGGVYVVNHAAGSMVKFMEVYPYEVAVGDNRYVDIFPVDDDTDEPGLNIASLNEDDNLIYSLNEAILPYLNDPNVQLAIRELQEKKGEKDEIS